MKKAVILFIAIALGISSYGQSNPNSELKHHIDDVFESYCYYNRFVGSVLISKDNRIIYQKSFGYADVENHKRNTKNSIFSVASVTKSLTAVGIMKLIEEGKLTLETPISTFFPSFIPEYSKKITIRHLLNHSSGLQANIGRIDDQGNGLMPGKNAITLNALFEEFKDSKLKFEPGTGYEYNNFGYALLAHVIESVTKQSYAHYMEEAIFKPASMKNTAVDNYKNVNQRAFTHIGLGMKTLKKLDNPIHPSWLIGAGNINATTGDLHKFMMALENGILLKPESVDKLYSYTQPTGYNDTEYGFGWRIENKDGSKWINHTGLLPGTASIIGSLPEKGFKVIILSNATTTDLITESDFQGKSQFVDGEIIDSIIAVLQGRSTALLPIPLKTKDQNSEDLSSTYSLDSNHLIAITKKGDTYALETIGQQPWSVFTYQFSRNSKEDNPTSETALFFANAMSTQNFEGLAQYGNDDMKGFLSTEEGINQLKGMWAYFKEQAGTFKSYNIYKVEGKEGAKKVHIRFHFEKEDVGFVLGINADHLIQGMFMDDNMKTSAIQKVKLTQINKNEFFINGHHNNGMQDLKITLSDKGLILIDGSTHFKAEAVNP